MIVIIGESASGKSTVEKVLAKDFGYDRLVSYTTRPPRENEVDGVDYHFISEQEFSEKMSENFFLETTCYRGWHYGSARADYTENTVGVFNPSGFRQISKLLPKNTIYSFYINVPRRERLIKMLERGDNIDEACRRSLSDEGQFTDIDKETTVQIINRKYMLPPERIAKLIDNYYREHNTKKKFSIRDLLPWRKNENKT